MTVAAAPVPSRREALSLFRSLLRIAREFPDYNIRDYTKRRTIDAFRQNRSLSDPSSVSSAFSDGFQFDFLLLPINGFGENLGSVEFTEFDQGQLLVSKKQLKLMNGPSRALSRTKQFVTSTATTKSELLMQHYTASLSLKQAKQLHAHSTTSGLLSSHLLSNLVKLYALHGHIPHTRKLFDDLPLRSSFLYNTVIGMYIKSSLPYEAIQVFIQMLTLGQCQPDNFTYPFVIKACGELLLLDVGACFHGRTMMTGFDMDIFVQNSLLVMYMNCQEKEAAQWIFDAMQKPSVASWNIMINGYFRNGCAKEAVMIFNRMMDVRVEPDCVTVVSVLPACGYMKNLVFGRKVHALVEEKGLGTIRVNNALMDMYAKCGKMDEAQILFDEMGERDVVTWTTMINGYILNGDARSALALCWPMQHDGVIPNSVTISSLLSACGSLMAISFGKSDKVNGAVVSAFIITFVKRSESLLEDNLHILVPKSL
ncbi:hypothetical protein FEM48_Zijuj04G0050400 [Ziziphus jujuba var. spinosa]|uniref:Complex 1 LYR protein domain-containing protein n=1 Tax=Ziziphus jujuba var. spinosa TaxID=714518 RepID=A0A978VHY3_ZIZJJ|nr:hypothetical protein FEM48_Zijuj04G0050400 [Ziziphus jujuba var. spinosa]